jgi:hypothetical protein
VVDPERPQARAQDDDPPGGEPADDADEEPGPEDVGASSEDDEQDQGPSRTRRLLKSAAGAAAEAAWSHRDELLAALELLRERKAVTAGETREIVEAYEGGDTKTQATIADLVERLEEANLGKVVIGIRERAQSEMNRSFGPMLGVEPGQNIRREDVERAGRRFASGVSDEVRERGGEVVQDMVRQGRRALIHDDTQEMERVFIKWATETLTTFERFVSRFLIGVGVVLILVAVLWSAHQVQFLEDVVRFFSVFLLVFVGILMISWSSKVAEWAHTSRQELDEFFESSPSGRLDGMLGKRVDARRAADEETADGAPSPDPPTDK